LERGGVGVAVSSLWSELGGVLVKPTSLKIEGDIRLIVIVIKISDVQARLSLKALA